MINEIKHLTVGVSLLKRNYTYIENQVKSSLCAGFNKSLLIQRTNEVNIWVKKKLFSVGKDEQYQYNHFHDDFAPDE